MRFLWSFIWAFLLCSAVSYVLTSMSGHDFQLGSTVLTAVVISAAVYILGEGLIDKEAEQ